MIPPPSIGAWRESTPKSSDLHVEQDLSESDTTLQFT